MCSVSRRGVVCGAALGVAGPLIVDDGASASTGRAVIATRKVPVGGGVVVTRREVVVTQPRAGRFRVFTAVCTHSGCLVAEVAERRIDCPCHGSQFAIATGAVVTGPADAPLDAVAFEIRNGKIYLT